MADISIPPHAFPRTDALTALDAVSRARNLARGAHLAVSALASENETSAHAVAAILDALIAELDEAEAALDAKA